MSTFLSVVFALFLISGFGWRYTWSESNANDAEHKEHVTNHVTTEQLAKLEKDIKKDIEDLEIELKGDMEAQTTIILKAIETNK